MADRPKFLTPRTLLLAACCALAPTAARPDTHAGQIPAGLIAASQHSRDALAPRDAHEGAASRASGGLEASGNVFEEPTVPAPAGKIDAIVFSRLAALGIERAHRCSDAVFIRRAYLDVLGVLPESADVRAFLADRRPGKRAALIDRLLQRDEFAEYWTMRWCDVLRVKAEFPINLWPNAAQAYHRWIFTAVRDNLPYDQFARTLLTASGSNFRNGPVNFYRAAQSRDPEGLARVVALTFLGSRLEHWPADQRRDLSRFFSAVGYKATQEWKEEIVFFDAARLPAEGFTAAFPRWPASSVPSGAATSAPVGEFSATIALTRDRDPREVFADWLVGPENPWFARAFVNRAWAWLLGRGIVQEVDDFRADNPPSNPELLRHLERFLVDHRYDVKALLREILTSECYQQSSVPRSAHPDASANFAFYPLHRLEAEVLIDALNQITGTTERYSSAIPEPFTFIPEGQRAVALPDGSITSSFLEMFGRPARDTGAQSERNNQITASQRLHLLNSTHVQRKIEQGPRLQALLRSGRPPRNAVDELYLAILSRPPTAAERTIIAEYLASHGARSALIDVAWSLINSAEFLYRH